MSLLDALKALDIDVDDHWTDMGLPRLGALKDITNDEVSRQAINSIAPKFSRTNPIVMELERQPDKVAPKQVIADDITNYVRLVQKSKIAQIANYQAQLEAIEKAGLTDIAVPRQIIGKLPIKARRKARQG